MSVGTVIDPRLNQQEEVFGYLVDSQGHFFMYLKDRMSRCYSQGTIVDFNTVLIPVKYGPFKFPVEVAIIDKLKRNFQKDHVLINSINQFICKTKNWPNKNHDLDNIVFEQLRGNPTMKTSSSVQKIRSVKKIRNA